MSRLSWVVACVALMAFTGCDSAGDAPAEKAPPSSEQVVSEGAVEETNEGGQVASTSGSQGSASAEAGGTSSGGYEEPEAVEVQARELSEESIQKASESATFIRKLEALMQGGSPEPRAADRGEGSRAARCAVGCPRQRANISNMQLAKSLV
mgnify:CR=1 FL=1